MGTQPENTWLCRCCCLLLGLNVGFSQLNAVVSISVSLRSHYSQQLITITSWRCIIAAPNQL